MGNIMGEQWTVEDKEMTHQGEDKKISRGDVTTASSNHIVLQLSLDPTLQAKHHLPATHQ